MKPIVIFRHSATEGPGYIATFLKQRDIPFQLVRIDAGEPVPENASLHSGLIFMGGPMSVNDDLPWIPKVEALIRDAVAKDIPLLGHCLGGQLISKALGAVVSRNPVKEIGWGEVRVSENDTARTWFGEIKKFQTFHWHGETFSLPQGAIHLLSSNHCPNQGYAIGKHLALQCHVEMTPEMIQSWCKIGVEEIAENLASPAVQTVADILEKTEARLPSLRYTADRLYTRWIEGVED